MRVLPYEIWLQIVAYLPDHQVRILYSVNRALYDISLDSRYKHAMIGILPDRVIEETQPPVLACGTHDLLSRFTDLEVTFHDSSKHSGPNVMQTKFSSSLKTFIPSVIHRTMGRNGVPPTVKLAQILHAMPKLMRVTKLCFKSVHALDRFLDYEVSLIFPEVVGFIGNRLRSLHIQSPFVAYLPPRLESLESFSLEALKPYHTVGFHLIVVEKVPAFIQAHKSTLREVSFSINAWFKDSRNMDMVRSLRLVSSLNRLNISFYIPMVPFQGLHKILVAHQQHLQSLTLGYIGSTSYFCQEWPLIKFLNLKNLSFCLPNMPYHAINLNHLIHSLVSLKMMHSPPTAAYRDDGNPELKLFCQTLSKFPHFQDLSLCISNFSIDHLILISYTLPHLHSLHVNPCSSSLKSDFVDIWISRRRGFMFCDWALESLDYRGIHGLFNDWVDQQMAFHLPNIIWINKRTRKECLSGPVKKPPELSTIEDEA